MQLGSNGMDFTEKRISKNAVIAMILGGVLIAVQFIMMILSVVYEGNLPFFSGVIESYLLLLSIFGIFWAVLSYEEEKTSHKFKAIGILLNSTALVLAVIVMAVGFMTYEI